MLKELETYQGTINIAEAVETDAADILKLVEAAPDALLEVSLDQIQNWIKDGQSIVAKNQEGKVIGHQGMNYWETPAHPSGMVELRSAYVDSDHRGLGVNTKMKEIMIAKAWQKYPNSIIIGFTESASKSRGILEKLGFVEIPLNKAPSELFSICPVSCFKKTGEDCGCKIYALKPAQFNQNE